MVQYKTEWEDKYAYSRIKKAGSLIETAGTIAYKNGNVHAPDDMYEQCVYIFNVLRSALQDHGSDLNKGRCSHKSIRHRHFKSS